MLLVHNALGSAEISDRVDSKLINWRILLTRSDRFALFSQVNRTEESIIQQLNRTLSRLHTTLMIYIQHLHQGYYNELYYDGRLTGVRPRNSPSFRTGAFVVRHLAMSQLCVLSQVLLFDLHHLVDEQIGSEVQDHRYAVPHPRFPADKKFLSTLWAFRHDFLTFFDAYVNETLTSSHS